MNWSQRLRSIPLWGSVLGLCYLVSKNWIGFDIPGWADISAQVLSILAILLGTASDPTDSSHF